jgi:hypothetical protein
MSAKIIPFRPAAAAADCPNADIDISESPLQLQAAVDRLEQLDHDLQIQANRINISIGEVRAKRMLLLKRLDSLRAAKARAL